MAVDMFLKIDGIDGESKDKDHKDEIDVRAWSWGMTQAGTFHTGGGGGSGKVNIKDMIVHKFIDIASPTLMLHCSNGRHIPEAVLVVRKSGEVPLEYVTITMRKVMVTGLESGREYSDDLDQITEKLTLNFAEVEVKYIKQSDKGDEETNKEYGWNIEENRQL